MSSASARSLTRRALMKAGTAGAAWLAGAPYAHTSRSAVELRLLLAHHWVPGADEVMRTVVEEGSTKIGVTAKVDFYSTMGDERTGQLRREAVRRSGHDLVAATGYGVGLVGEESFEPLDDVMSDLIRRHGAPLPVADYICRIGSVWRLVPSPVLNHTYPQVSRIDHWRRIAGIDFQELFPAHERRNTAAVDAWNWDVFLKAARKLHAAGYPVGNPIATCSDANDTLAAVFLSFGANPVDAQGNVTLNSDGTRQALEFMVRLAEVMPRDVFAWDDTGNNKHLLSGRGSAIFNPPSAWAWARKNRPEMARQIWHHDVPAGPSGRYRGMLAHGLGVWSFAREKAAAKDLLRHLWEPDSQRLLLEAAQGFDIPLFPRFADHPVWQDAAPPMGGLYNYPVRGDERIALAGYPAPYRVGLKVYTSFLLPELVTRVVHGGDSYDEAIEWAQQVLEARRG